MSDIKFDTKNYRKHDERNLNLIKKSLEECGTGRSIVIDNEGEIIAGNATYEQAKAANIPVKVIEVDGKTLIALKRTDLSTKDKKRKQLALMDNSTSDKVKWDLENICVDFDLSELPDFGVDVKKKDEETEGEVPFTEELLEEHNYVVLYFDNKVDWLQAETLFGLKQVQALDSKKGYKKQGVGRVLKGSTVLENLKKEFGGNK